MTMYNTLLLDTEQWDLVLDANGNIALAQPPYAIAQDLASAVKLFRGELWYDTTKGVPYYEEILGQRPPLTLLTSRIEQAALSVPGVVSAKCIIQSINNGSVTGQVQVIDESGAQSGISF